MHGCRRGTALTGGSVTYLSGTQIPLTFAGGGNTMMEFAITTPSSFPEGLTSGPDGNLWFTENSAGKIGHIPFPFP